MEKLRPREEAGSPHSAPSAVGGWRWRWGWRLADSSGAGKLGQPPAQLPGAWPLQAEKLVDFCFLLPPISLLTFHSTSARVGGGWNPDTQIQIQMLIGSPSAQDVGPGPVSTPTLPSPPIPPSPQFSLFPVGWAFLVYWKELKAPLVVCVNLNKLHHLCEPHFAFRQNGVEIKTTLQKTSFTASQRLPGRELFK